MKPETLQGIPQHLPQLQHFWVGFASN